MKNFRIIVLTAVMVMAFVVPASFAEVETSGTAGVDVMSSYVWRGIQVHEDTAIQPYVEVGYGGFSANIWGDYNTDPDVEEAIEADLTLNYSHSIDKLGIDAGYIYYAFDGFEDTEEFYLSVGYDTLLSPAVALYWDVNLGDGGFVIASIGHSFPFMGDKMSLNLGASASYNLENEIMGYDEDGDTFSNLYNGEVSASLSYAVTDAISIEPRIAYTFPLSDDAENAIESLSEDEEASHVYGGAALSVSF